MNSAAFSDENLDIEDLVDLVWPERPLLFDPDRRLSPEERFLAVCLMQAGFSPVRIARLEDDPFGTWDFRIQSGPDDDLPKVRRGFRRRLQNAVLAAELRPVNGEITEVASPSGTRRLLFCTRIPAEAEVNAPNEAEIFEAHMQ